MERYICIHGHFYQPPRENAWLEAVELQDSAYPYHDWNERITAECYAPNAVARILDGEGRIARLHNNYARISFNFGPTLLSWMQEKVPDVYRAILEADRDSQKHFSGHGSALAQAYNHVILPLTSARDRRTQIAWGLRDFEYRFGRPPEGMWLPETAVDLTTLDALAEQGVRFTILSPYQAGRIRRLGESEWQNVAGGHIDPTRAYLQRLPTGRSICLFFYDGPIARAVAFERLLARGETFAARLREGFADGRDWPQLVHIATDGESYGHHHTHGDMALACALENIRADPHVRLTNYGEYLARHLPTHEVEILENTSWSCSHGIERWRSDCGCSSGRPGWNQAWRAPLREALDGLRDALARCFEQRGGALLKDPWQARDEYVSVVLDRAPENVARFLARHAARELPAQERVAVIKLLELQRNALLMYTSCGWFFDDISGLESVQIIQYAGRAVQLGQELFAHDFETPFLEHLAKAKSNLPEHGDGRLIYERWVKPAVVDWKKIGAHYAVSSLFESYPAKARVYCFTVEREDLRPFEAGKAKLLAGRATVTSELTGESEQLSFGVLHFGDHNVNGGVRDFQSEDAYEALVSELTTAFAKADFPEIIRILDRGFGASTYSLRSLFRDEQRGISKRVLAPTLAEAENVYRRLYEQHLPTMRFLADLNAPLPRAFQTAAEFLLNTDLRWAVSDDEPNPEHIRNLLREAGMWRVTLDTPGLAYKLRKTIRRMAERFRDHPGDPVLAESLDEVVALARTLPFEVDLWRAQNAFFDVLRRACPEFLDRAAEGDDQARAWLKHFVLLGEKLGVQVAGLKSQVARVNETPTAQELVRGIFVRRRTPLTTYRLQLNAAFPFAAARALAGYLDELGVTDCYTSPILRATPGSTHGYDITDHGQVNPELGGEKELDALAAALRERGLGLLLDIVPNHMGIGETNAWWMDVLENGPASPYAAHFDIDWHPVNPDLENKLLLPVLGEQYGAVLESGQFRLAYEDGAFYLTYYDKKFPVAPGTYRNILELPLEPLATALGPEHPHVQELRSILTALSYLPPRTELPPEKVEERTREKEIIKRRIAALAAASPEARAAIAAAVAAFNGRPGDPRSFDLLNELINAQAYRPAYWRVAAEEINYRRFFDVNELAAIRVEHPEVFQATHQLIFRLLAEGKAHGLRIDHPDGLWNPASYFRRLQENYALYRARVCLAEGRFSAGLQKAVADQLAVCLEKEPSLWPSWPLYVVAEKILAQGEALPHDWAVCGTTGYDFLNSAGGLFVDRAQRERFDALYTRFTGLAFDFSQLINSCQKIIMLVSMASEVNALSHQLDRISERNRRYRDFTLNSLTFAIREIVAALVIYRTYITGPEEVSLRDRMFLEEAVEHAKAENPRTAEAIFDFVRDTVLLRNVGDFAEEDRPRLIDWAMKFQQLTGPVLAKGLEDTAFYVYNRLTSLNEVGGHPEQFGVSVEEFHQHNAERRQHWPHSMLATSSHDTKRGEDVRARIHVLSELPGEWETALQRWSRLNAAKKTPVEGAPAPDANDEYLLYQTLLGAWPGPAEGASSDGTGFRRFRERMLTYMQKAIKEAKVHTSWVNPNEEYDAAMRDFICRLLPDDPADPFLTDLLAFQKRIAFFGYFNSLAQLLLKLTSPGVSDLYQGCELWSYVLVDPDNRQPVDYELRKRLLAELRAREEQAGGDLLPLASELVGSLADGRVKLYVTSRGLRFRRAHGLLFLDGNYEPLEAEGEQAAHVCAFRRSLGEEAVVAAVPRLVVGLTGGSERPPLGAEVWSATQLVLPPEDAGRSYRNLFTGEVWTVEGASLPMAAVLGHFPVALLERLPFPAEAKG
jgi:(1->4)-alpha-D-glucan 1-alpha-D-glucosylmutase